MLNSPISLCGATASSEFLFTSGLQFSLCLQGVVSVLAILSILICKGKKKPPDQTGATPQSEVPYEAGYGLSKPSEANYSTKQEHETGEHTIPPLSKWSEVDDSKKGESIKFSEKPDALGKRAKDQSKLSTVGMSDISTERASAFQTTIVKVKDKDKVPPKAIQEASEKQVVTAQEASALQKPKSSRSKRSRRSQRMEQNKTYRNAVVVTALLLDAISDTQPSQKVKGTKRITSQATEPPTRAVIRGVKNYEPFVAGQTDVAKAIRKEKVNSTPEAKYPVPPKGRIPSAPPSVRTPLIKAQPKKALNWYAALEAKKAKNAGLPACKPAGSKNSQRRPITGRDLQLMSMDSKNGPQTSPDSTAPPRPSVGTTPSATTVDSKYVNKSTGTLRSAFARQGGPNKGEKKPKRGVSLRLAPPEVHEISRDDRD